MAPAVPKYSLVLILPFFLTFFHSVAEARGLSRQKREWIIPPRRLVENIDYTGLEFIAKIRSDKEYTSRVFYSLTGAGADQQPIGLFTVNSDTGLVRVHSVLDREKTAFYDLKGVAKYSNGDRAEKDIDLRIVVVDQNDCEPVFEIQQIGSVNESSAIGTVVMRVIATDADQADTPHSQIYYSIVETGSSSRMFSINSHTGEVVVQQNTLDRETQAQHTLTIQASDLNGQIGGNSGTGQVVINLLDINDNIPTLERETYEGSVEENTVSVEVMRVKAVDMDLIHTANWEAVYTIISGNEAGYFTITTDAKTNEGIIMIQKPLDYEELKVLNLGIAVSNKAEYNFGSSSHGGSITQKTYPIKINVVNQKEGPRFQPTVKVVTISEDQGSVTINKVITNYAAIDSDTLQTATNVRYAKLHDADNWLIIDEKTADIKLNKLPDRESKFLINGTYYAKIICISNDVPSKTATGTLAIQVEDFNDHCPTLTATTRTMCFEDNAVYLTAVDQDEFPNSAPFDFRVIQGDSKAKWTVEHLNDTTAILRDQANLWPGTYKVAVEIKDQQGKSCADVQVVDVIVCTCHDSTKACVARRTSSAVFGASGVLLLLLGLLLLLLVPLLLLFCLCGGAAALGDFKAIPFDTKQQLISYHTEGQGEDKEVPLLQVPVEVGHAALGGDTVDVRAAGGNGFLGGFGAGAAMGGGAGTFGGFQSSSHLTTENMHRYRQFGEQEVEMGYIGGGMTSGQEHFSSRYGAGVGGGAYDGMALSEGYLAEYYGRKASHAAEQSQQKDALLIYDYEGQGSLAGSVGCCSLLDNEDDLAFLDDLGPKFNTLAEICQGSALVTESVGGGVSVRPPRPPSPARPSTSTSTHTHVHTHSETMRDQDHVNVNTLNTLNTSNVASGSSTIVQDERFSQRATVPRVHVQDNVVIPGQTLLIQQPTMYYAAAPMYVVEANPQMVLVAGAAQQAAGQVGLGQGLVQVGGFHGSQAQGMVLVDRHMGASGAAGQTAMGLSQGSVSRSKQVRVVENGSASSAVGGSTGLAQARRGQGSEGQALEVGGHGVQVTSQSFSLGSRSQLGSAGVNEDFSLTATPVAQGNQRVVVQHKKVSVTERNIETRT